MNLLARKTLSTLLSGAILFSGMLSYSAYASGEISRSTTKVGSQVKVTYSFDVDGNKSNSKNNRTNGYKYGQHTNKGFSINSKKTVTVNFNGASYSSAKMEIYKQSTDGGIIKTGAPTATVAIPMSTSGMPTLSGSVTLPAGNYTVRFISTSVSSSSKGSITISYADGVN